MLEINVPRIEDYLRVLSSYAGRDKTLRSICFGLILISTKTKNAELAKSIQALAKQISLARTVCRQLNHLPLIIASKKLYEIFQLSSDRVDSALNLFVMISYVFYQFFETASWLTESKIVSLQAAFWYKWAIYTWLVALIAGISQILRRVLIVEPEEDRQNTSISLSQVKQKELNRRMDRITLVGLSADFIAGFNLLPHQVLWAGKLSQRTSATLFFVASAVGLYKLF